MPVIQTVTGPIVQVDADDYNRLSDYRYHVIKSSKIVQRGIYSAKLKKTIGRKGLAQDVLRVPSHKIVAFKDGNTFNCRKNNLEIIKISKRNVNARLSKSNRTGYKGVSWNPKTKKYMAYIKHKGEKINLGSHKNILIAAKAYNKKAVELFGDRARLNIF
jgi:hypothetical protein